MKKNLKLLAIIVMAGMLGLLMNLNVFAAGKGTVTATVERFVLGGDYIVEPTIVEFTEGETYADILERILNEKNLTFSKNTKSSYGYYFEGIKGVDCGIENMPQCVKDLLENMTISGRKLEIEKNKKDGLYEFSYTQGSGWMYYVNNKYVNVGMKSKAPEDGDVVRYMFTLAYGADLTGTLDKSMTGTGKEKVFYKVADKTELIRYIAQINQNKARWQKMEGFSDSYNDAMDVLATIDASQWDVDDVLAELESYFPDKLTLNKNKLDLDIGKSEKLSYTFLPAKSLATVFWSSDNNSVATVKNGVVTGTGKGTTKIHATTINGLEATCSVTVKETPEMTAFKASAPTISVKALSYNSVKASWKSYKNATSYDVYRRTANGSWKKLKSVKSTSYTDETATTGTTYYYKVKAKSSKWGSTTIYSKDSSSKKIATKLGQVTLKSVSAGKKCATIKWNSIKGASGYKVYRATSKNGKYTCIKTVKSKVISYKNTKLTKGKTYYYKIRAYRTVNSKAIYGNYSKIKSTKIK